MLGEKRNSEGKSLLFAVDDGRALREKTINEVKNMLIAVDNMGSKSTTFLQDAAKLANLQETKTLLGNVVNANHQQNQHDRKHEIHVAADQAIDKIIQQKNSPQNSHR